jgi:hypothetical protein
VFSAPAIVLWLRRLERRDSSQDAPPVNHALMRDMAEREDLVAQNHMGSVVLVKPGILRMALFRAGHLGLGLFLRMTATKGYLGSMRTVHFAHWAFVNNRHRLMFFSNFDHSWESYLDDFIEKAHGGLTLAWGSGVGFPPARRWCSTAPATAASSRRGRATPWCRTFSGSPPTRISPSIRSSAISASPMVCEKPRWDARRPRHGRRTCRRPGRDAAAELGAGGAA